MDGMRKIFRIFKIDHDIIDIFQKEVGVAICGYCEVVVRSLHLGVYSFDELSKD